MQRSILVATLVTFSLPACRHDDDASTVTPGTDAVDDGSASDPDSGEVDDPARSRVRSSVGVSNKAVQSSARERKVVVPKRPPRTAGSTTFVSHDGGGDVKSSGHRISSVRPTALAGGGVVEIFGQGFGKDRSSVEVRSGAQTWTVMSVEPRRIIARAPSSFADAVVGVRVAGKSIDSSVRVSRLEASSGWAEAGDAGLQGLVAEVFPVAPDLRALPDFAELGQPVASLVVARFDLGSGSGSTAIPSSAGSLDAGVALRMRGSLNVDTEGEYEFCLTSDDAASLYLEDTIIVDDARAHAARERCELVYLEAGEYGVDLHYLHARGPELALKWTWSRDGGAKTVIPASVLFRP